MTSALNKLPNLAQRIITGVLGAIAVIFGVAFSEWTYFLVFFLICLFTLLEFYKLAGVDGLLPLRTFGTFCGMVIFSLSFFVERGDISPKYYFVIFPLVSVVYMIKLYKRLERKPFTNIAFTFLGIFYVAIPFALLNIAAFNNGQYNFEIIWGSLFILWATDTGAYFAGTYFGKSKLFPRISPKKSWEGAVGGAVLALVFAVGIAYFFKSFLMWQWLVIAAIIIVGGIYGDLVESLLKRSIEIKDSGDALPGHGGFLDRFDGLLISAPSIVAFIELVQ
jgi:phosphatidate cytidylyltransferase